MRYSTYQIFVDTLVELPFLPSALPELLVALLKTLPVLAEDVETRFVDIVEPRREKKNQTRRVNAIIHEVMIRCTHTRCWHTESLSGPP